jgi:hypothetical protein
MRDTSLGEWLLLHPRRFNFKEKAHATTEQVFRDGRARLEASKKRKIPIPCRDSNRDSSIAQAIA